MISAPRSVRATMLSRTMVFHFHSPALRRTGKRGLLLLLVSPFPIRPCELHASCLSPWVCRLRLLRCEPSSTQDRRANGPPVHNHCNGSSSSSLRSWRHHRDFADGIIFGVLWRILSATSSHVSENTSWQIETPPLLLTFPARPRTRRVLFLPAKCRRVIFI